MRKLISKSVLFAMVCILALSSCESNSPSDNSVTVVGKYKIAVTRDRKSQTGIESPGINALVAFADAEIAKIDKDFGKAEWTITVKAKTEKEGQAEVDKKANEEFASRLTKLNEEVASLKVKLEAKRKELAGDIVKEKTYYVKYETMQGSLWKEMHASTNDYWDIIKDGTSVSFEAIGGTQY